MNDSINFSKTYFAIIYSINLFNAPLENVIGQNYRPFHNAYAELLLTK